MGQKIDLNGLQTPTELETKQADRPGFSPAVLDQLPPLLKFGVDSLADPTEKSVFLMGALGVISGLLPNIQGLYDGQNVFPNLYVFVIGPYGAGKGALSFARMLGQDVHRARLAETLKAKENHQDGEPEPPQLLHFIPANNSKTGFFELLNSNQGAGTLFESEGDTLSDAIRQDFGNFSDGLRKGFHHEPISFYRRANREFVEIDSPRLAVVLSSTFDQMLTLIPTAENGLFSRFLFFNLPGDPKFRNVFDASKNDYTEIFRALAAEVKNNYNLLTTHAQPIRFTFSDSQQARFVDHFQSLKRSLREDISTDLDGVVNRLGLHFFRLAMIFSTLRTGGTKGLDPVLVCDELDFNLSRDIVGVLTRHAIEVYLKLPQPKEYHNRHLDRADDIKRAIDLHRSGQSYGAISQAVFGDDGHKSTVYRWINS